MTHITPCRAVFGFCIAVVVSMLPWTSAASIPATVQAIRIPAENLAAVLPGGLDMETIDPSIMRRIEKAIQMEKAFEEAKWEGNLSTTELTRINSLEEPVIQFNNTYNMGMSGDIEVLRSSEDGLVLSCKIDLGLDRKGTLADAKAPNFGDRLARRSKRVSGVFQLADGTHTLLAALPACPTDEDEHTLLFILTLGKPDTSKPPANPHRNGLVTIETFRMPMEDWHRIPSAVRDDPRQLHEKCRAAAGRGKIERIDRISTCATSQDKVRMNCGSVTEITYPTSYGIRDQRLDAKNWECRNVGPALHGSREVGANASLISISYEKFPQLPVWSPTLKDGTAKDVSLSRLPVFGGFNFSGSFAAGGSSRTCLLGIAPVTAGGDAPTHVALMFATAASPASPVPKVGSEIVVEVLVARGPSGVGSGDAGTHIKSLLAHPGNIETIAAATAVSNQHTVVSSRMEWIYPTGTLGGGDSIVIPSQSATLYQGTELRIEYQGSTGDDPIPVDLHLKHSLRKPDLPMGTNHGASRLKPEIPATCDLTVNEELKLTPGNSAP